MRVDELVAQKEAKLVAGKQLELVYRRFTFTFWASLLVSGGLVVALWPLVQPQILLAWLLSLWLVMGARRFYAQRYLSLAQDTTIEHGKWIAGLVLGAVAAGACWGMTVLFLPATPLDAVTMMLIFVIAGVIGFASVTLAAVPLAAAAFMLPAVLPLATWLCSFGERVYYFMGGISLTYLALMIVFSRQMHSAIRSSHSTSEQNKELAAALKQVKALEYAAAQKENEQRYQELFANFEDSILFIDVGADGKFSVSSLNPAAERTFGMRDADARGKSKFDLFPADLAARLVEYDLACVESGRPLSYEDVLELPSGTRYFSVTQIPMRDDSGRVYRIAAISRDITERKQMEEMLAAREREFRALVENAPDPIFRYDRECRRIFANQMVARTSGIPLEKLLGQTPTGTALVPSPESVKVQQSVQRVLDTGVADEVEVLFVAPDGGEMYFQNIHVPEFAADGSVQSVLSMGRDITARKYMESVLQKSEREYRALAENAPDNILRYDRECRIRYLNKNAEASLGMPAGYLIGKTPAEVFTDGIFDELEIAMKGVVASGQGIDFYQTLPDTGKGERYHHLRISPERDERGEVNGILSIGRDITERKQMEDALVVRERQFRALAESTPDPIYRYDRDCRRIYVNPAVTRLSGKSAEELLGSKPADGAILVSEQNQNLMTKIRRVFDSGEVERLDIDYTSRSGEHRDYQMMLVPERDDSGAVATVLGIARDVTDIRNTERRLSQFVANVPGYVYTYKLHSDGRRSFLFASPGIKEIYGVTPEEGATNVDALSAMVHPDDAVRMNEFMAESARSLTPSVFEYRITHPTKGVRWLELRAAPEVVGDGIQWHGMTLDITERKLAEESLQRSEQLMRAVIDATPDWIFIKDQEHRYQLVNQGYANALHISPADFIGKNDLDLGFPEELVKGNPEKGIRGFWADDRLVMDRNETQIYADDPATIDGEVHTFHTIKVPLRDEGGKPWGVLAFARDITERKQAASHLEETRARLQTVMNTIPDMLWLKDADGAYLSCNPAFERLYGASEAEIIGKTDYDFVDAELADFFRQKDRDAMDAGHVCINEESVIYADNGRPGILETRKVPVFGADGKVVGVLGVARDITERKAIEKAFNDSESMLQEAQRIAHVGSWDVDMVNDKLTWSDEIFRIWEIDKTKFRADFAAFMETVHPEDRERVGRVYNEAVVNHSLYEVEHRLLFPDGRVKHILERGEPQYDAQGKPVRFIGTSLEITERKQAQQRMELLERAIDFSADTVFLIDEQLRFRYVNATACRSLGYSREELLAMGPCDIDPDMPRELALKMMKSSPVGETVNFETHHRAKDGRSYPVELSGVHFEDGGEKFSLSVVRDITERKRMQEELAEREREFRSLAGNIPDNIARWDTEGRYLYVNPTHECLLGMKREDLIGQFIPDSHAHVKAGIMQVAASGQAIHAARQSVMVGDVEEVHDVSLVPEFDDTGKIVSVLGMGRNMTERYRMLETIAAREQEFRSLAENLPDSVVRWDAEGRYSYINPTLERALGVPCNEVYGKRPGEAFTDGRFNALEVAVKQLLATGGEKLLVRQTVPNPDGSMNIHDVSLVPEIDAEGRVIGVLGLGRDITDILRMQETIAAREQEFRSLAESSPDFIIRYDCEGRTRYINTALVRELELDNPDELMGKRPSDTWPDGRFDDLEQAATRAVETGEMQAFEMIAPGKNGELSYSMISVVPERDANGGIIGTIAFGRDVTVLRSTERLMQMIGDHMPGALTHYRLRADLSGELLYASRGLKDIYGVTREELADGIAPMIALIHPDDLPKAAAEQEHAAKTLTTAISEFRVNHPEKGEIWVQQITTPVPETDGSMLWYSLMFDISERKRMEGVLVERQAFLDSLFEAIPVPVFYKDRAGCYLGFNRAYESVFGANREQLLGKSVFDTHPRELAETYHAKDAEVFERRVALQQYEYKISHANGELRDVLFSKAAFTDALGEVKGLIGAVIDITERKQAEAELTEARNFLNKIIDSIPDPIFVKDRGHRWVLSNEAFCNLLGQPREALIGKSDYDFLPKEQSDVFWEKDELVFASGATNVNEEAITGGDGDTCYLHTKKTPFVTTDGRELLVGVIRDITERKQAEHQLKDALEFSEGVINAIPDLLFEVDREGRYLNVWAQNPELLAAQKELLLGNTIYEVLAPEAAAISMAAIREAEEKGLSLGKTMSLALPHGESWFELSVSRKSGGDSSCVHFLVLSRDVTERKLAEVALRASEALAQSRNELLQAIVESSPEIIVFALDRNYRYLSFNQKHKEVMQAIWGKEIAVGASMLDVIGDHPDRKSAQRGMDRALAGESFVHEEAYGDEALSRQYWQNYWSPIRSDAGKVVGLTCFVLNITERKKAEEAVRESGEKLRSLFELSPLGIALTDMQGRYVEFNESFRAICGYPADELMTLDYWTLTPREYEMQEIAQLESLAKTGRYGPYEKQYRQKDGTLIPIQLVGTLITGKDGQQHIWSIVEDIRERKRTEAELKERLDRIVELNEHLERTARDLEDQTVELEAQAVELEASQDQIKQTEVWYRSILHSAPDGLLVVDDRGFIMLVNERLEAMFGYERGELQGHSVEVLIPHAVRERHVGMRDGFIAREDAYRQAAKTLFGCRKDGTEFPVDVSLARLPEVEGMRSAICASVRDISARHAMEAAREAALEEVQHLAQLRSTFMAQMSHELRTPLNGILGYAQNLLQGDPLGEKQTTGLQIIQNSGEHLLTLINGILDHAAIEADKFELIPGDIELEPFLSTLIGIIRVRAEQKNLAFVCDADAGLPAVVRGDAQRLRQVLLNLLSNAVKFTDSGQVTLRVTCSAPSRLRFAVQDSGVGIAAEQLETIFIPFEQGGEVSRRAGGTGLGLAISRKLVRLMGGDIMVESQPGAGCTFSFEIDMGAVESGATKINVAALSEQAVTRVVQATSQLLAPPREALDVFHGSALRGNMREIIKHADRLAEADNRYQPFAEQLCQLAKGFQTKALLSLIEQYRNEEGIES
jgi:PAS domain S-box-containing protein